MTGQRSERLIVKRVMYGPDLEMQAAEREGQTRMLETKRSRPGRASGQPRRGPTSLFFAAALASIFWAAPRSAVAQEILLTGPLKGASAVHKQRLYRKERFEFALTSTFTLLDEYMRQLIVGARLNYNLNDYLAIGAWGGLSPSALHFPAGLVDKIQVVNEQRAASNAGRLQQGLQPNLQNRLTSVNLGQNFEDQLGTIDWIVAPQLTFVPFRGKIALFQNIYADTDLYFFAGPAIVSLNERADCAGPGSAAAGGCSSELPSGATDAEGNPIVVPNAQAFPMASRIKFAPTFGLGFTFYVSRMIGFGFEWRATPMARNTGGFDNHGGGPDADFPDQSIDSDDADLKLNQMLSLSLNIYMPFDYQVSE